MSIEFFLPNPNLVLKKSKSLAMLDAIYCQQWDLRYFSHNSRWAKCEEMSSMRDGEGGDYFILFSPDGAAMKGGFHEGGLVGDERILTKAQSLIPSELKNFMSEPAFSINDASFLAWFDNESMRWTKVGAIEIGSEKDDGIKYLTEWLKSDWEFYENWASEYYETQIDKNLAKYIFDFQPFHLDIIKTISLDLDENQLIEDINEIGYPRTL